MIKIIHHIVNFHILMKLQWVIIVVLTGVFAGGGTIDAIDPAFDGSTFVAGAWANFAVAERHTLHFLVRREDAPSAAFTVAEVGFTYRLPGN